MTRYVVRMALADGVPHELLVTRSAWRAVFLVRAATWHAEHRRYNRRYWVTKVEVDR